MRSGDVFSPHLNLSRDVVASIIVSVPGASALVSNTRLCVTGLVLLYFTTDSPILIPLDGLSAPT